MTKKYFGTDGIRGEVNSKNINGNMFFKFGLSSGIYFKTQKKKKQIAIMAKDTRLSGYTLEPALNNFLFFLRNRRLFLYQNDLVIQTYHHNSLL